MKMEMKSQLKLDLELEKEMAMAMAMETWLQTTIIKIVTNAVRAKHIAVGVDVDAAVDFKAEAAAAKA